MKEMIKFIVTITIVFLMPLWLYASGNLPRLSPPDERMIVKVNSYSPRLSEYSYQLSHWLLDAMRDAGFSIECTYTERLQERFDALQAARAARLNTIEKIRTEVIAICDSILEDTCHCEMNL